MTDAKKSLRQVVSGVLERQEAVAKIEDKAGQELPGMDSSIGLHGQAAGRAIVCAEVREAMASVAPTAVEQVLASLDFLALTRNPETEEYAAGILLGDERIWGLGATAEEACAALLIKLVVKREE